MNAVGSAVAGGVTGTAGNAPKIGTAASIAGYLDNHPGNTGSNDHCHGGGAHPLDHRFLRSARPLSPPRGRIVRRLSPRRFPPRSLLRRLRHQSSGTAAGAASVAFSFAPAATPLAHCDLSL